MQQPISNTNPYGDMWMPQPEGYQPSLAMPNRHAHAPSTHTAPEQPVNAVAIPGTNLAQSVPASNTGQPVSDLGVRPVGPQQDLPEPGAIGPIRVGVCTPPNTAPYWHEPRRTSSVPNPYPNNTETRTMLSGEPSELIASSVSSVSSSYQSNQSITSNRSIPALRTETLTTIRANVKALQGKLDQPDEIMRLAEPLFHLPDHERWPAALVLIMTGMQEIAAGLQPATNLSVPNSTTPASGSSAKTHLPTLDKSEASQSLKAFIRQNMRLVLLRSDLDSYGRRAGRKNHAAHTPFGILKDLIDKQGSEFQAACLPPNYREDPKAIAQLETMLTDSLKAEKHLLATIIKDSMLPTQPVDKLSTLVADVYSAMDPRFKDLSKDAINNDPTVTKSAKARLAYLRIMINLNRHQRLTDPKAPTFWHQIDDDLQVRMRQGRLYRIAFAQLILKKDRALWNGTNFVDSVSADDIQLPTKEEIEGEIDRMKKHPTEDENEDVEHEEQ